MSPLSPTITATPAKAQRATFYNSDDDDGDLFFGDFIPDTPATNLPPAKFETQATQIMDQSTPAINLPVSRFETQPTQLIDHSTPTISSPIASKSIIEVPATSPLKEKDSSEVETPERIGTSRQPARITRSPFATSSIAKSMAPVGTLFKAPNGVRAVPTPITIDDDDRPAYQTTSSDDEIEEPDDRANIKPSSFATLAAQTSFGASKLSLESRRDTPQSKFQSIIATSSYTPGQPSRSSTARPGFLQTRPERAQPVNESTISGPIDEQREQQIRRNVVRLRDLFPHVTISMAQELLTKCKGSLDDAAELIAEIDKGRGVAKAVVKQQLVEPQMKVGLKAPIRSIQDRYSSTQALQSQVSVPATPPKPKKRLIQGRRHPSSPAVPSPLQRQSSPEEEILDDIDSDSGVASEAEPDSELEDRVLEYLNTCSPEDLVELTSATKAQAATILAARPYQSLDAVRGVGMATLKSGKKSAKASVGDRIVDHALDMFTGYEAVDALVAECELLGKPLATEMESWGFDVFGASKNGELEMTSLSDENEPLRDSGIGSPVTSSPTDDDIKIVATKKKSNVNFLKKPEIMAESCVLKDYQIVGLNWLALMYRQKLSGILADEMGLGKTCQVISFLSHLVETGIHGPHLVICPGAVLENWLREFQTFAPALVVEPYYGAQKDRPNMAANILDNRDKIHVIVSTYDMAAKKQDNTFMRSLKPNVCVYDEGHYLKNLKSLRYQGLIRIPAKFRLLLTGTPLQNNLQELAALLAFILPNLFQERQEDLNFVFKAKATTSDHAALLSAQRIARARSMLTPFVLRRKKAQVLKHLPPKTCRLEMCQMHPSQKLIYDGHLDKARERARLRLQGTKMSKSDENNPMMQLRKASIHSVLFRRHFTDKKIEKMADILRSRELEGFPIEQKREHLINEMRAGSDFWLHTWCQLYPCISSFDIPNLAWMDSGKVDVLVRLLKEYKENGDRVLIFSQFSLVLDVLEAVLNTSLISFTRIDGSTKVDERQTLIDNFRDDESITAFLLTTKAGGTGINLMYANKVIIFDSSFNPQDDRQAENRAHRVGQTRPVEVIRLVTSGTVEEQIYKLGQSKLTLDGRVSGGDDDDSEEAGEKAVSRMLLEGVGLSDDDLKPDDGSRTTGLEGDKIEDGKPSLNYSQGSQKKQSIIGMLTKQDSHPKKRARDDTESQNSKKRAKTEETVVID